MSWATVGLVNDPEKDAILADTGSIALAATLNVTIIISTQYAARAVIVLRDAQNTTDVGKQLIHTASDHPATFMGMNVPLSTNQRLVIRAESAMIGEVQASILW